MIAVSLADPVLADTTKEDLIKDMKVVETIGKWQLRKGVDSFTDQISCVMLNNGNGHYQATNHDFFIKNEKTGRIYAYRLRFDDHPPTAVKTAGQDEVLNNYVDIEWFDYGALLSASRLRAEITTKAPFNSKASLSTYTVDLDVEGFAAMRGSWKKNGCPS
jgi:hypothetical protein